jgi:YidC/Oxa1 family membrane protein insertase
VAIPNPPAIEAGRRAMQQPQDNKNLFLAIALSILVIIGWNAFYGVPKMQETRQQTQTQPQPGQPASNVPQPAAGATPSTAAPANIPGVAPPGARLTREAALASSPRIAIEAPRLRGSIALKGGRIDDLLLTRFRETIDPTSPNIELFSPSQAPNPYYAEFGWVAGPGSTQPMPNQETLWTAPAGAKLTPETPLVLTWENGQGLVFSREIAIDRDYMFTVRESVRNTASEPVQLFKYGLISRHGTPQVAGFFILHEGMIGVLGDQGLKEVTYADLVKAKEQKWSVTGGFVGITDKYWAAALVPDQQKPFQGRFLSGQTGPLPTYQADVLHTGETVAPGSAAEVSTRLFAGAKEVHLIDGYERQFGIKRFELMIDWGWFYFITKPMFYVMDWFNTLLGNFGLAILAVTVLIKIVFFPLANKSYASMAKMKAVQPMMVELQTRYKDDRMQMQQKLMELYKKEKINPLAGCWPVLIQIPVFFALYKVLFVTIEMRHAPFFGWIKDLAAPDPTSIFNLFGLLPFAVPAFLLVGVWPIVMGITMWLQMKMNPEPTDPVQKAIFAWMPLVFTFMLASFPAGLVIYWAWNNLLSILQQYYIMRKFGVKVELWDNLRGVFKKSAPAAKS